MALHVTPTAQSHGAHVPETQERRPIPFQNLAVGAFMNLFQGKHSISNISVPVL